MLQTLNRNSLDDYDEGDRGAADDGAKAGPGKEREREKRSKRAAANRSNSHIEKNPSALNLVRAENEFAFDPLFHKMSKAFDEGGAKGMLINNLRLSPGTCSLSFACKGLLPPIDEETTPPSSDSVDITDLVTKSGVDLSYLAELQVCPALDEYREQLQINLPTTFPNQYENILLNGLFTYYDNDVAPTDLVPSTNNLFIAPVNKSEPNTNVGDDNDFVDDNNDWTGDDNNDVSVDNNNNMVEGEYGEIMETMESLPNNFNDEIANFNIAQTESSDTLSDIQKGMDGLKISAVSQDYAFFDINSLSKDNSWAGARHWKYASARQQDSNPIAVVVTKLNSRNKHVVGDNESISEGVERGELVEIDCKKKKKSTKSDLTNKIEFSPTMFDETEFGLPSCKKIDSTIISSAMLEKGSSEAEVNSLLLPQDAKIEVKDLCRLFLAPKIIVPSSVNMKDIIVASTNNGSHLSVTYKKMFSNEGCDRLWGKLDKPRTNNSINESFNDDENNFYGENEGDFGDDGEAEVYEEEIIVEEGLGINQDNLLQAKRTVEKINIKYE
jgi:hypothetical protein